MLMQEWMDEQKNTCTTWMMDGWMEINVHVDGTCTMNGKKGMDE